jgi:hypothetical protein
MNSYFFIKEGWVHLFIGLEENATLLIRREYNIIYEEMISNFTNANGVNVESITQRLPRLNFQTVMY